MNNNKIISKNQSVYMKTISEHTNFRLDSAGKTVIFYNDCFESKEKVLKSLCILHEIGTKKLFTSYKNTAL